ncbi:RNA-directed DNA polymerase from mobile element jockey [Trichonephila clavipes]|nr:RNA-directed DNA polymerase from mobile element jockey [Trichonephila clavipes]
MYSKGFDIVFCWLPSHVGIIGNEQADSAAKSATTHLPLAVPLSDMKRVIMHHIFKIWQESWSQQLDNKLHSVKPVIGAWPVMPMRRTDVKLTRLRIGHTRFTHRHLLFGERAPECPSCHVSYTVRHILIDCPVFNLHRISFFHTSILTLSDLYVVTLHTSLQAVAVRIHVHSLVTVCCVYLPPNDVVPQVDLNHLVSQLPAPFILLGDFNGHSPLWGHDVTNSRGRQIEQLISDHCLCLLNNDEKTYFHAPTRTFHSLDLAICSPTLLPMLNFEVANDLHNSDHFPLLVSHVNGAGTRFRPPT